MSRLLARVVTIAAAAGNLPLLDATTISPTADIDCEFKDTYPNQYVTLKTSEAMVMDGNMNEVSWQAVPFTEDFVDISTDIVPKFTTKAKILWDDEYLYVAAVLQENQVWANISSTCHCIDPTEDQVIFHDNDFEIFIDPDGSNHFYKEFEINAQNATWDLVLNKPYSDGGYENSSRVFGHEGFDMLPPLRCGVSIDGGSINDPSSSPDTHGWTVEVAIPLASLAINETVTVPPADGVFWRINFSRVEWGVQVVNNQYYKDPCCQSCPVPGTSVEDNWVWTAMGEVNMHVPDKWGLLQFRNVTVPRDAFRVKKHDNFGFGADDINALFYDEWPIRSIAMIIYYAEHSFYNEFGTFTSNVTALNMFASPPVLNGCCSQLPEIVSDRSTFVAQVTDTTARFSATVRTDRLLTVFRL